MKAWSKSDLVLFFKKRDWTLLKNYRLISLLSPIHKPFFVTNRLVRRFYEFQPPEHVKLRSDKHRGPHSYYSADCIICRLVRVQSTALCGFRVIQKSLQLSKSRTEQFLAHCSDAVLEVHAGADKFLYVCYTDFPNPKEQNQSDPTHISETTGCTTAAGVPRGLNTSPKY